MAILYNKKNRAVNRILRSMFRAPAKSARPVRTARHTSAPAYSLSSEIPEKYNDTYVRAMPIDPKRTFVYWEIPETKKSEYEFSGSGKVYTESSGAAAVVQNSRDEDQSRCRDQHDPHDVNKQHERCADDRRQDANRTPAAIDPLSSIGNTHSETPIPLLDNCRSQADTVFPNLSSGVFYGVSPEKRPAL